MITFKHEKDKKDWTCQPAACDKSANARLKLMAELIALIFKLLGLGDLLVTSYYRPNDKDSYHSILQAFDMRTHDKPRWIFPLLTVVGSALRKHDHALQIYAHPELLGTPNEHIHVAIKDGKIVRT